MIFLGWNCHTHHFAGLNCLSSPKMNCYIPFIKTEGKCKVFCSSALFFESWPLMKLWWFKITCFLYVWLVVCTLIFVQDVYTELFLLCFSSCYLISTLHGENMCQRHTRQDKYIVKNKKFSVSIEVFFINQQLSLASDFRRIFGVIMLSERRLGYLVKKKKNISSLPMQMLLESTSLLFWRSA